MERPDNFEHTTSIIIIDLLKKKGVGIFADSYSGGVSSVDEALSIFSAIGWAIPSGWYDQEKLNYSTLFDAQIDGVVDLAAKRVSPHKAPSNGWTLPPISGGPLESGFKVLMQHRFLSSMLLLYLHNPAFVGAEAQTAANQAALACALERYRLANGQFPETLEALTPRFISRAPNDVITGQPYKYRRADDGRFILYSVGWNEKDDGGVPGNALFDSTQGDWVWSYPAQ